MKKMNYGCLFDLDGVLIDSETEYTRIWGEIERCFPTGIDNFPLVIKGTTLPHILETYFDEDDRPSVHAMLREMEGRMEYRPLPGVIDFLDALTEAGIPSAIVTSSNTEKMERLYVQLPGFREYFDAVITDGDVSRSKPDPEGYILAARRIGVASDRCCVFEDSYAGLEAGRAAGGAVAGLATTNPRSSLEGRAHIILDSFEGLQVSLIAGLIDRLPG